MTGKCPKCDAALAHVTLESIEVRTLKATWLGVSYVCPSCHCILNVSIDPIALKSDLISGVVMALQGNTQRSELSTEPRGKLSR